MVPASEFRPVWYEGVLGEPYDTMYVGPTDPFAFEVLDISADHKRVKIRVARPDRLHHPPPVSVFSNNVIAEQVLSTGSVDLTPQSDPLLCAPGTYTFTTYDLRQEIVVSALPGDWPADSLKWDIGWGEEGEQIPLGNSVLTWKYHAYLYWYLDLQLSQTELVITTRLAQPEVQGKLYAKPNGSLVIGVTGEILQPSGFTFARRGFVEVPLQNLRTVYDPQYYIDVADCAKSRSP
jgi:hypothetical protein